MHIDYPFYLEPLSLFITSYASHNPNFFVFEKIGVD